MLSRFEARMDFQENEDQSVHQETRCVLFLSSFLSEARVSQGDPGIPGRDGQPGKTGPPGEREWKWKFHLELTLVLGPPGPPGPLSPSSKFDVSKATLARFD